ncbi:hypothetical protein JOC36_000925 [Weissella uvarum]|uniref:conjugal transfer protein n=1 Tax=Weissella uvarum TaxID=1479233 RepID=UPI00195F5431|nr:conjugal transfer protein [Weissella uvarum]MBM7617368.1 hypothetical protein [Weissella uvarum]MCM0595745.1 conjugal transfer protein [Weissella uvarum]
MIGLLVISGPIAFISVKSVSHQNKTLKVQLKQFETKLDKAQTGSLAYNPALGGYMQNFVRTYINQSGNVQDFTKWKDALKPYFAKDLDTNKLADSDNWKEQHLISAYLVALYVENNTKIAQLKVEYKIKTKEEEVKHNKKHKHELKQEWKTKTVYLNVPYQAKDNQFTVVAYPFVSNARSNVGHISEALVRNTKQDTDMSTNEVDDVTKFATKFLNKYTSSTAKEMSFIMNEPAGLNGEYTVTSIDDPHVSGTKEKPRISGTMMLKQKDTGTVHSEQFDLKLKKQDNTYFVSEFGH